jgi:chaperone modulatory protein CbpM
MTDTMDSDEARLLGESDWIAVTEICRLCRIEMSVVVELTELGIVSPRGYQPQEWQFPATALTRLRTASRLMRDLGINVSGAALAVELLEVQRDLERRIRKLERLVQQ